MSPVPCARDRPAWPRLFNHRPIRRASGTCRRGPRERGARRGIRVARRRRRTQRVPPQRIALLRFYFNVAMTLMTRIRFKVCSKPSTHKLGARALARAFLVTPRALCRAAGPAHVRGNVTKGGGGRGGYDSAGAGACGGRAAAWPYAQSGVTRRTGPLILDRPAGQGPRRGRTGP